MDMEQRKKLRNLMKLNKCSSIVGAYDALSAKLVEQAGCEIIHVGGYNLSAVQLGLPDVGYLTLSETVSSVSRIAACVETPVIADGDDGYGNYLNIQRLIRELEKGCIAGVHIEDQVFPKRCGHMAGKRVVSKDQMVSKIKASVDARIDNDFVIIARTDAIAVNGFDDAMERAHSYAEAGADIIFVEAPLTIEQVKKIPIEIQVPTLFNWCYGGRSPVPSIEELNSFGYRFSLYTDVLYAVSKLLQNLYSEMKKTGSYGSFTNQMIPFDEFNKIIGLDKISKLEEKYGEAFKT